MKENRKANQCRSDEQKGWGDEGKDETRLRGDCLTKLKEDQARPWLLPVCSTVA